MSSVTGFGFLGLIVPIFWLICVVGIAVAVVLAVRALRGIEHSLNALVEQGVARGEGPVGTTPAP